jgi:predicted NACHT family NTPase
MRDRSSPRIPAPKILDRSQKKAVVLGAPGSGKTMLVSYFALMLCETQQSDPTQIGLEKDTLPIVVRIRDWILQPKMGLLEYLEYYAKTNLCTKDLPTGFFEHWLERGRALILLDGLDEVVDEAQRRKVAEQIETFLHRYQNNPAVITSRPAGYRWDFFNLDEFPHYTLESFDDKQVATFIDHWYDSRLKGDTAQAARRKADLQSAFARNERIRLLAKNPLLLTIITLIHRYQAELPRQRFKLYEKAVETLLTSWDSGKEIKLYDQVLLFLKPDDLLYILKKLAYWIHTQGSTGETEGGTLIDKDELLRQLQREIKTLKKCEPHEAKGEAERSIDFIQRRTNSPQSVAMARTTSE